ncbi:MAG: hypothetical protein RIT45_1596, partial [Pseudomonadota bacterium]
VLDAASTMMLVRRAEVLLDVH